jgi:hypothetical protein
LRTEDRQRTASARCRPIIRYRRRLRAVEMLSSEVETRLPLMLRLCQAG